MKEYLAAGLTAVSLVSFALFTGKAECNFNLTPVPDKETVSAEDTTVTVTASFEGNTGFSAIGFELKYPEGYTFLSGTVNEAFAERFTLNLANYVGDTYVIIDDPQSRSVKFVAACIYNITDDSGSLCSFEFAIPDDEKLIPGTFEMDIIENIYDDQGRIVPSDAWNCYIQFDGGEETLLGDINCDGSVDIDDAVLLFRHSMLPDIYTIPYRRNIDFTKDGNIDVDDAVLLFRYSMLPDIYPISD